MAEIRTAGHPPKEEAEQAALFEWALRLEGRFPALGALYHVPNEGKRSRAAGDRLKAQGLKAGVPDICLPVPSVPYCGLYIEMKRAGEKPRKNQEEWIVRLRAVGHRVEVCRSFEEAAAVIMDYLNMGGSVYHVAL